MHNYSPWVPHLSKFFATNSHKNLNVNAISMAIYQVWAAFRVPEVSYNTSTHTLPYIQSPSGVVRIYQAKHSCLCYNLYQEFIILGREGEC